MNYVDEIFNRCNFNGISNYLLYGSETIENSQGNYRERLQKVETELSEWLNEQFPDFESLNRHTSFVNLILSEMQGIYMQIGLQAGIMLASDYYKKHNG